MEEMYGKDPILKFFKEDENGKVLNDVVEMKLKEFSWPKGGIGVCPACGAEMIGKQKNWECQNEECGLKLNGPIM